MKRLFIFIFSLLLCSQAWSQYIGWGTKRISRNIRWECDCKFETLLKDSEKFIIQFTNELGVTKMVFYLENDDECYGYSVYCDNDFEKKLDNFIEKNYSYNEEEDFYENRRSFLFYQSDKKKKIIHVIDRYASSEMGDPF